MPMFCPVVLEIASDIFINKTLEHGSVKHISSECISSIDLLPSQNNIFSDTDVIQGFVMHCIEHFELSQLTVRGTGKGRPKF